MSFDANSFPVNTTIRTYSLQNNTLVSLRLFRIKLSCKTYLSIHPLTLCFLSSMIIFIFKH